MRHVVVIDPFDVARDQTMSTLALALKPLHVQHEFERALPHLTGGNGVLAVRSIRVTRYKPKRRCVIEYDIEVKRPDAPTERVTMIGKVRAGRFGNAGYRLLKAFWDGGFGSDSPDGISVPEPVGTLPKFQMWLQRKVSGRVSSELLMSPDLDLVRRIPAAARKIHEAGIPAERTHTVADELRILRERLSAVAKAELRWADRLGRVLEAAERLGAALPEPVPCGIHRDFYPDQVIVNGNRLYVVDFDLYCEGDPGLDIGNFLGHITEHSLRTRGDPGALAGLEQAVEERFVELAGEATRTSVRAYATLTLARHISLSTTLPDRGTSTGALLELCEERLGIGASVYR